MLMKTHVDAYSSLENIYFDREVGEIYGSKHEAKALRPLCNSVSKKILIAMLVIV